MHSHIIRKSLTGTRSLFIVFFLIRTVLSHLNSKNSFNSLEPQDIFFFESPPIKSTLIQLSPEKQNNMTCGELGIDESCILLKSNVGYNVRFQYQSMECDNCTLLEYSLKRDESHPIVLSFASLGTVWQVTNKENKTICPLRQEYLGENSWYHLFINETGCFLICDKESEFVYIPLLIALGAYMLLAFIWIIGSYLNRLGIFNSLLQRDSLDNLTAAFSSTSTIEEKKHKSSNQRLRSLDTVRGIAIVVMIFVNFGAGKYQFLDHSTWNGLTVADLVFPWFIWMMGMSMALSLRSQLRKVVSRKKIFFKIVKRSIILFALGIMLNTTCTVIDLNKLRIPGVLQRFGISYFVVATVHLFYASTDDRANSDSHFADIIPYGGEWLVMLTVLTLHLLLSFFVHAPDCPRGYFGPGGLHDQGAYADCTGGAAGYIDRILLGPSHLYQHPSSKAIYKSTLPYDPEGILGYLTSIFLVYLGLQAGKILLCYKDTKSRVIHWMSWGILMGAIAALLCKCSKNDGWIPVNKNLWSVSFILATGSLAFILLTICYLVCDVQKWWSGAPFYHAGMNSIVLYLGHSVLHHMFPFSWQVSPTHMNELFIDLWGVTLWVIIAVWMHHKNTFISV